MGLALSPLRCLDPRTAGSYSSGGRALNSAVECHLHTVEVEGSNPSAPTSPAARRPSAGPGPMTSQPPAAPRRSYRYYDLVMAAFVTVLLCANVIGAGKVARVGPLTFGAGVLFFPISYLFGDVLTEVYGYARARKVVWAGFGALAFASLMAGSSWPSRRLPSWHDQAAYETVFGATPRIALASLDRVLLRRVLQLVRAREDEGPHGRPPALDPHHRLHDRGRGRRLGGLLPARLPGRVADRRRRPGDGLQLRDQGAVGGG